MDRLLLIDGSNLLFQMYYGMPARIVNSEGKAIQGTFGFAGALLKMIRMVQSSHVVVLFDGEHENPRTALDEQYKANRGEDERFKEDSPYSQLEDVFRALSQLRLKYAETTSCEADDWMAGYVHKYGKEVEIVIASMDSDFFQLISKNVSILRYRGKSSVICNDSYIRERFGIKPEQYFDYKSLTGDSSDNIPGAPGIGPKTAARLLHEFGTLNGIIAHLDEVKRPLIRRSIAENIDRLLLNQKLIRLEGVKDVPFTLSELSWCDSGVTTVQVLREIGLY